MSRSALRRRAAVVAAVGLVVVACTSKAGGDGSFQASASPGTSPGTSSGVPSGSPSASASAACPASYAQPDPHRPRIRLTFDLAADLASVHGTEDVTFTPDLPVRELVFRLTANTPPTVRQGNRIEITAARSDPGGGANRFQAAGAAPRVDCWCCRWAGRCRPGSG